MLGSPPAHAAYSRDQPAPRRRGRWSLWRPACLPPPPAVEEEHRISERVEAVAFAYRRSVRLPHQFLASEAHHHCQERRAREVEVRQQRVHGPPAVAGIDEELRLTFRLAGRGPGLER